MTTTSLNLTTNWTLVTANAFVGQTISSSGEAVIFLRNDTTTPTGALAAHKINESEPLAYPKPLAGNWYARVLESTAVLTFTEV